MWFDFNHFLPEGVRQKIRNTTHGNPIADKTNIASIIYPPFSYLLKLNHLIM